MSRRGVVREFFSRNLGGRRGILKVSAGILTYLLILLIFMQPVIANGCDKTYLSGPGDQSAFAWLYEASPNTSPLWGNTTWTNAPYGENVSEPFNITGLLQYSPIWLVEKAVGSTCAFNIHASFGYIFTATIMLLFVLWLTNRKSYFAAWLAGFLVAFSPYLQVKTMVHVSYVYSGLLVLILWLILLFWTKPRMISAVGLAVLGAALFYHDPYFIMLGIFIVIATVLGIAIFHRMYGAVEIEKLKVRLRYLLIALPIFIILVLPVVYVRVSESKHIETVVGDSRDADIMVEGKAYGARPWEFVLPANTNPVLPDTIKEFQDSHRHGSNYGESTLFLGYTSLLLASIYAIYWFRKGRLKKAVAYRKQQLATLVAGSITVVGGLMALPPLVHIGSLTLYFPSWILLSITTMWRVPARFFVILQIGLVILAILGLIYLIQKYKDRLRGGKKYALYCIIVLFSLVEFATFNPFNRTYWTQSMIPSVYTEVKENNDVDMVAEYPMLDPPRNYSFIFYLSYQSYHQKPMINSAKVGSPTKRYRESMADLYDWQTPGALKALGVDRVLVHDSESTIRALSSSALLGMGVSYDNQAELSVASFGISESVESKNYLLAISDGFDGPSNYGFTNIDYFMHQSGVLKPVLLPGATAQESATARIEFYAFEKTPRLVKVVQDGKVVAEVMPTEDKQVVEFTINPSKQIMIMPTDPPEDYSFVISNMEIK